MKTAKQSFNPDSTAVALLDDASKIVAGKTLFINGCIARAGLEVLESIQQERTRRKRGCPHEDPPAGAYYKRAKPLDFKQL